jgi:hypothetical protein
MKHFAIAKILCSTGVSAACKVTPAVISSEPGARLSAPPEELLENALRVGT